jgi:hypothetical protein
VILLTIPWAYNMLAARTFHTVSGITAIDLPFNCQLQYYYPPEEPVNTLKLTCPRMEMMRLWPLLMNGVRVEDMLGRLDHGIDELKYLSSIQVLFDNIFWDDYIRNMS